MLRVIPKKGCEIGHTVREAVEAVEQSCPRATGCHGHDSVGVRHRRPDDSHIGYLMAQRARP